MCQDAVLVRCKKQIAALDDPMRPAEHLRQNHYASTVGPTAIPLQLFGLTVVAIGASIRLNVVEVAQ